MEGSGGRADTLRTRRGHGRVLHLTRAHEPNNPCPAPLPRPERSEPPTARMRLLKPQEAATLPREALEAHIVSLLRRCPGLLALRGAHAHLLRLRLPRLTAAFALSKLLASCASARAAAAAAASSSYARNLFDQIPDPTAFCYNSLIRALPAAGPALAAYRRMLRAGSPRPNSFTLAFALKVCAAAPAPAEGRQLHAQAFRQGLEPGAYFVVSDDSHPEINEIRLVLREIADRVRRAGHKPWTAAVLHDVGEEEKEVALCEHSERLAIAYGLLKTKAPHVIRVLGDAAGAEVVQRRTGNRGKRAMEVKQASRVPGASLQLRRHRPCQAQSQTSMLMSAGASPHGAQRHGDVGWRSGAARACAY
ncbi:hypothetical protein C2845_PM08G29120 [Panicum miliaceum]|uniref:DYW domain-containing protein n=1 Tax=Panicum miliaceum TaxID=4540 RepID=A0A3L6QYN9_PANMI|nr:hypothetical protein C2845_PM08G29120 [Panicum miliaceum]